MKYILKGENNYNDCLNTILKNRNITEELFDIQEEVIEDYNHYDDIEKGIEILMIHINNNNKIVVLGDCDSDGVTSFTMIYRYIQDVFDYKNLYYIIHKGKEHGLDNYTIKKLREIGWCDLLVIPDASSNDYKQHKWLKKIGIDILVLDHHDALYKSKNAIIINNQLSKNVYNKRLSGAGVTYKFLKALDDYLFDDKANKYLDLVALGNIADVMNLQEKETRYLCYKGVEKVNNTFLKALIDKNAFQLENKYNINKVGWVIAPKLNGTIRSGSDEVKEEMFKAFISDDYAFCSSIADKCKGAKDSQDSAVKTALSKIEKQIDLSVDDRCLLLEVSKTLNKNHTGLVANKLQEKYGVPTLIFREKEDNKEIVGGSGRGNDNITKQFKEDLIKSNLFEFCEGHEGAFGFEIKKENVQKLKIYLNELYKDKEIISGKTYEVDLILDEDSLNKEIINKIAEYENEWGNGIPEPLIAFENLMIGFDDSNIKGTRSKALIFECNGVKFIKKFLSNDLKNAVLDKGMCFLTIIGKCVNNIYNGNSTSQVEIVDMIIN